MYRRIGIAVLTAQLAGCGGGEPPKPQSSALTTTSMTPRTANRVVTAQGSTAIPTISIVGEKFCVTGASYFTEHQGRPYPTTETACDYSQQRVVINCPGGCMAAQSVRYAIQALPVGVLYSSCSRQQPSFEPGNYYVDPRTGSYFVFLSGYSSKHYETANPDICKDVGQTVLLGFMLKRASDGALTPLRMQLSMLP
jgi:hypothetical protein